jgi:hypothetical protein
VKHTLCYLKGTKDTQLTYGSKQHDLKGFCDADGSMQEDQHAITGYAFLINGSIISWSSKKQELVTLLTAESEYVTATHTSKKAKWLHKLLGQLFPHILHIPTALYCDNQSAIKLATTNNYHSCTKHLDQHYHYVQDVVAQGMIKLVYCPSKDIVVDPLIKALLKWKVKAHANALGLHHACGGVAE